MFHISMIHTGKIFAINFCVPKLYMFLFGAGCVFRRSRAAAEQTKARNECRCASLAAMPHKKRLALSTLRSALNNRSAIILVRALAHRRLVFTAAQSFRDISNSILK
jgi:hypothetical protein